MAPRLGYLGVLIQNILLSETYRRARARKINPRAPHLGSRTHELAIAETLRRERDAKLPALFKHYRIDPSLPDAWHQLAMSLAIRHVPGFQARVKMGAPVKATLPVLCSLYRFVNRTRAGERARGIFRSDNAICASLPKDKAFVRSFPSLADCSPSRLHNLLMDAKQYRRDRVKFFVDLYSVQIREDAGDAPPWQFAISAFAETVPESLPPGT